jgi:hypothetical protein
MSGTVIARLIAMKHLCTPCPMHCVLSVWKLKGELASNFAGEALGYRFRTCNTSFEEKSYAGQKWVLLQRNTKSTQAGFAGKRFSKQQRCTYALRDRQGLAFTAFVNSSTDFVSRQGSGGLSDRLLIFMPVMLIGDRETIYTWHG